jgi:hypothetical protein
METKICSQDQQPSPSQQFTVASKILDVSSMDIVYRGKAWNHQEDPSAKSVGHLLERNESIVTWLQPRGGSVEDQVPAIRVNGMYRGLSLRMQKCIWKHIRLKQGFVNLENLSQVRLSNPCVYTVVISPAVASSTATMCTSVYIVVIRIGLQAPQRACDEGVYIVVIRIGLQAPQRACDEAVYIVVIRFGLQAPQQACDEAVYIVVITFGVASSTAS